MPGSDQQTKKYSAELWVKLIKSMTNSISGIIFTINPPFTRHPKSGWKGTTWNVFLVWKYCHTTFETELHPFQNGLQLLGTVHPIPQQQPWLISTPVDGTGSQPSLTNQINRIIWLFLNWWDGWGKKERNNVWKSIVEETNLVTNKF